MKQHFKDLCLECARTIHNGHKPTEVYAMQTADLLMGTIAQESAGGKYRRQIGFGWSDVSEARPGRPSLPEGAWGITQLEHGSVSDSLKLLRRKPVMAATAAEFMSGGTDDATPEILYNMQPLHLMRLICMSDRLAVLLCRLHYKRIPALIPSTLSAQAEYWKLYYNTTKGKGTVEQYLRSYRKHAQER